MVVRNGFPHTVRGEAELVKDAWEHMPDTKFGRVVKKDFHARIAEYDQVVDEIRRALANLRGLRGKRKDVARLLWEEIKNIRDSVGGTYGRDSVPYHRFGRVRTSDRKSPRRASADTGGNDN